MDHERFRDWFSRVDELTAAQRKEVAAVLSDPPAGVASLARSRSAVVEATGAYEISPWFCAVRPNAAPRCGSTGALAVARVLVQD